MNKDREYCNLGMGRAIARRDFLQGVAIGLTGAYGTLGGMTTDGLAQASTAEDEAQYPPLRKGLRGQYPAAVAEFDRVRESDLCR